MPAPRHLALLAACLLWAAPAAAQETRDTRDDARALVNLAERGRVALQDARSATTRLRERVLELEADLARDPAGDGTTTRAAAQAELAELRAAVAEAERAHGARGPSLAEVEARAQGAVVGLLARFAAVEPDLDILAQRLGDPARPAPSGLSCAMPGITPARLVVCRTGSLAELDRELGTAFQRSQAPETRIQRRLSDQEQRLFYERLEGCASGPSALLTDTGITRARDCLASRYRARIDALQPSARVVPVPGQGPDILSQPTTPTRDPGRLYVTTRSNLRSGPGTSFAVVAQLEVCAELRLEGPVGNGEWLRVSLGGRTAFIAAFLVSDSPPAICTRPVRGTVQRVIDPARIVVDEREIRLHGIVPRPDELSRRGMAEILSLYGNQVSCALRTADRFVCRTPDWGNLEGVDLGIVAVFNGGACPAPNTEPAYDAAYRDAQRRGSAARC